MWLSNLLLKKFQVLKEQGLDFPRVAGTHIGRGFADLGYEQFLLISESSMVSLFTGAVTTLPDGHAQHFFWIPSVDELIQKIVQAEWHIQTLTYVDNRRWALTLSSGTGTSKEFQHRDLHELLVDAYTGVYS